MKVAWITGGGTGIGKALAEALYREGWRVVISGRRKERLEEAAQAIRANPGGGEILAIAGDATDPDAIAQLVREVTEIWGPVDLLVNNAGANPNLTFEQTPPEDFEKYFRINCLSAIRCADAVLPAMRARNTGTIVNISSIYGKTAAGSSPAYSVSKYALTAFTEVLQQGLAGTAIHVMGVYPGFIRTPMTLPFVRPGSVRSRFGRSPEAMAQTILRGLRRKKREILYPWYVPWVIALHTFFPGPLEKLRRRVSE